MLRKNCGALPCFRQGALVLLAVVVGVLCTLPAVGQETIFFGAPPYKNPAQLNKDFAPLIDYLEAETGLKIQFRSAKNGGETVKALLQGGIHVAYLMPALFVRAHQKSQGQVEILGSVLNKGNPFFRGLLVVETDSPIQSLQDLQGKKVAFGFRESTLAFYIPAFMLIKAGVLDSMSYKHVGKPENVAVSVQKGFFDTGGIRPDMKGKYVGEGGLRILQESEPIRNAAFVTSPKLPDDLKEKFAAAFAKLDDPAILQAVGPNITGLTSSTAQDYANLAEIIKTVDQKFPRD